MRHRTVEHWPADRAAALQFQATAAEQVEIHSNVVEPQTVVAVDTDYGYAGKLIYAAAVVLAFPSMKEIERSDALAEVRFPYLPGLLFFREGPVIIEALSKLKTEAEVIIVNGHGTAHPDRCGLASHIGILFDRPSIGCARKLLAGNHRPVDEAKGSAQPLLINGKEVGLVYRSKESVKPIYLSPGHKCDLAFTRDVIARSLRGYRLPEPMRVAHLLANRYRQRAERDKVDANEPAMSGQSA